MLCFGRHEIWSADHLIVDLHAALDMSREILEVARALESSTPPLVLGLAQITHTKFELETVESSSQIFKIREILEITYQGLAQTFYLLGMTGITIALGVLLLRHLKESKAYRIVGVLVIVIAVVLQVPGLAVLSSSVESTSTTVMALTILFGVFKLYMATVVGMYYVHALNEPLVSSVVSWSNNTRQITRLLVLRRRGWILAVLGSVALLLVMTKFLFWSTNATPNEDFQSNDLYGNSSIIVLMATVVVLAFTEEIIFRLGIQNWLSYAWGRSIGSHGAAIVVSTVVWTLGHTGMVQPDWVKLLQIFIMGLILGTLNQRFGILACIAVHVLFNIIVVPLAAWLI